MPKYLKFDPANSNANRHAFMSETFDGSFAALKQLDEMMKWGDFSLLCR